MENEPLREQKQIGALALAVSAVFLFAWCFQIALSPPLSRLFPEFAASGVFSLLLSFSSLYVCGMPVGCLLLRACRVRKPEHRPLPFSSFAAVLTVCVALTALGGLLGDLFTRALETIWKIPAKGEVSAMLEGVPLFVSLPVVGLLAPAAEELFYRKLLIDRLRPYGDLAAILTTGILFGLIHGNFRQFFYAFFVGTVLGLLYCRTGRVGWGICVHAIINLANLLFNELTVRFAVPEDPLRTLSPVAALLIARLAVRVLSVAAAPFLMFHFLPRIRFAPAERPFPRRQCLTLLLNPAVWFLLVILIILFL